VAGLQPGGTACRPCRESSWGKSDELPGEEEKHKAPVPADSKQRVKNVKGAFTVKKGADVENKRIILVDDVMTTGATINECSRVLRKAGAKEIFVLTAARKT